MIARTADAAKRLPQALGMDISDARTVAGLIVIAVVLGGLVLFGAAIGGTALRVFVTTGGL